MRKNAFRLICVLAVFAAVLLGGCGTGKVVEYDDDLRAEGEELVFSFELEQPDEQGQPRKVSVCVSTEKDYIVCRIGTKDNMELVFPERHAGSWGKFTYESRMSIGSSGYALEYLSFDKDKSSYKIFESYSGDDSYIGISVKNKATGDEDDLVGLKEGVKGGLMKIKLEKYPVNTVP